MEKTYFGYEFSATFGFTCGDSRIAFHHSGNLIAIGSAEDVCIWDIRRATIAGRLKAHGYEKKICTKVTSLTFNAKQPKQIGVGYENGSIGLWESDETYCGLILSGHKLSVTAIKFDSKGRLLGSGSNDASIVIWDVTDELGLYRLRGHKAQITDLVFLTASKKLVSCSKDSLVKVWNLDHQNCCQTLTENRSEVWSLDINQDETRLVTGSSNFELLIYRIASSDELSSSTLSVAQNVLIPLACLRSETSTKSIVVRFDPTGHFIGILGAGNLLKLFRCRTEGQIVINSGYNKRKKRSLRESKFACLVVPIKSIRLRHKAWSFDFQPRSENMKPNTAVLAISLSNNSLELHSISNDTHKRIAVVNFPGHNTCIRTVALTLDETLLLTMSSSGSMIWDSSSGAHLLTLESTCYGLAAVFVPTNSHYHAIIGTKDGKLEIVDALSGKSLNSIRAHRGPVWSLCLLPDRSGIITGGADHNVNFWQFGRTTRKPSQVMQENIVKLSLIRTLRMRNDVICVRCSPDKSWVAIASLDASIKIFQYDQLNIIGSLHGHSLPVLSMDISCDGLLLASGGTDKILRIWRVNSRASHNRLLAHQDSITEVIFVRNTHRCFSAGKDSKIRFWDCDKSQQLLVLEAHHEEVWAMAIASSGAFIISAGRDRSIRRWVRTEDSFFIDEVVEDHLGSRFVSAQKEKLVGHPITKSDIEGPMVYSKSRMHEVRTSSEQLEDALDLVAEEIMRKKSIKDSTSMHSQLFGLAPTVYVWRVLTNIHTAELEQALAALPFTHVSLLLRYLPDWLSSPDQIEKVAMVVKNLHCAHQTRLRTSPEIRLAIARANKAVRGALQNLRAQTGFNLSAMQHLKQRFNQTNF